MKQPAKIIVQLVHIHGALKGKIQGFSGHEITIGRNSSCDLQFPQDLVVISRKHATIVREGNRFKIVDQSTNGTFVNGERITEAYLKNGDVIFFTQDGPKVSFLTQVDETSDILTPSFPLPELDTDKTPIQSVLHQPVTEPQAVPPQSVYHIETTKVPLIVQYGPVLKAFNELPITLGSDNTCDLVLDHPSLAGQHVQIFFSQGSYRVKDLTGRNPVLINSQPIISPSPLMPGDQLFLTSNGPAFHFLEGGRMAEINMPQKEAASDSGSTAPRKSEEPSKKKSGSLFKKLFR